MKEKFKNIKSQDIVIFIVGLFLGILVMLLFYPDRIAKLENGEEVAIEIGDTKISADNMYTNLKESYSINSLVEIIDETILGKKYELNDEDYKAIDKMAQDYISYYESTYEMGEEEFLKSSGFENMDEFKDYLKLDYMRDKYYKDSLSDEEVQKYYDEKVYGPIKAEHILVKISSDVPDSDAKALAQEILDKLKNGMSWADAKEQYKDKIITEALDMSIDSSYEEAFVNATLGLKDGSISNDLVKTSYGYHIINRISSEEKPALESVNDKVRELITKNNQAADEKYYQKVLIKMREDEKVDIKDTELKKVYDKYLKLYK